MGFGVGEYDRARANVLAKHGEMWAERLDALRPFLEYGPTYRRSVWDDISRAFHALGKPEPESAEYWWDVAMTGAGLSVATGERYVCDWLSAQAYADSLA